jgi:hypothetical protein
MYINLMARRRQPVRPSTESRPSRRCARQSQDETLMHTAMRIEAPAIQRCGELLKATKLLVPPDRQKHGAAQAGAPSCEPGAELMRRTLAEPSSRALYKMRKAIVEPVSGQIEHVRGIRQLRIRG